MQRVAYFFYYYCLSGHWPHPWDVQYQTFKLVAVAIVPGVIFVAVSDVAVVGVVVDVAVVGVDVACCCRFSVEILFLSSD